MQGTIIATQLIAFASESTEWSKSAYVKKRIPLTNPMSIPVPSQVPTVHKRTIKGFFTMERDFASPSNRPDPPGGIAEPFETFRAHAVG